MKNQPKISIVTIAFNNLEGLRSTITSVLSQNYANIEYIIIDGGSFDGSKDLIKNNERSLAYWTSEPDNGIYDAINKGVKHCTGDWIIFMNAGDDFYSPSIIQNIFTKPIKNNISFIYGDCITKYEGYQIHQKSGPIKSLWNGSQFSHQSVFIRADIQKKYEYNKNNRISADFEFFFEAYINGHEFQQLNSAISRVSAGGLSDVARLENITAFYRVVRHMHPSIKVHLYFLSTLSIQFIKLTAKKLIPTQWIHLYRRNFKDRV